MKIQPILLSILMVASFSARSEEGFAEIKMSVWDTKRINIDRFTDPIMPNITCYISRIKETSFFQSSSPSDSDIHCIKTRKTLESDINKLKQGYEKEVYTKSLSISDKALRVNRYYDEKSNSVVYVSYSNKTGGGSLKHAVTAVFLAD